MNQDQKARDQALLVLEFTRGIYLAEARNMADTLYNRTGKPISVDDIRQHCPPPHDIDPRVMGAVFDRHNWKPVGFTQAKGHGHGRMIRTFIPRSQT